ncbi:uncharacterized protein LOC106176741 [Lingula anatina]|uniref:Uncharacterized protein LOC106176741 n=1 Tax=Lingula anatina TaxID=7574 RepID=A0A1S3JWM5_LINAN|nr:uncharacterized protein LOC106176741 [Lingula anatina]|eukprot:XP_013414707.1 uncharacterized protein LOC106176741 [Lingula anatina]
MGSGSSTSRQSSAKKQVPQNNMKDVNQNQQNLKEQRRVERTENQINHEDRRVREEDEVGSLKEELDRTISRDYDKMPPKRGSRSTLDSGISRDTSDGLLRHEHTALSQQEQEDLILNEFHSSETEEYPEKYADRLRKQQQHDTVAFALGREKTVLVRNPEEWNIDTSPRETDGFDPNKFKAVNKTTVVRHLYQYLLLISKPRVT